MPWCCLFGSDNKDQKNKNSSTKYEASVAMTTARTSAPANFPIYVRTIVKSRDSSLAATFEATTTYVDAQNKILLEQKHLSAAPAAVPAPLVDSGRPFSRGGDGGGFGSVMPAAANNDNGATFSRYTLNG